MSLSIIIPVYNEIKQLKVTIKKLPNLKKYFKNFEIVFVDDFSNDGTLDFLLKTSKRYKFINVVRNKKKGLGSAIHQGILRCKKKYVCIQACDQSDDVNDLKKYYKILCENDLDAVFGSRFIRNSKVKNYPFIKLILNRIFNLFVSCFLLKFVLSSRNLISLSIFKISGFTKLLLIMS